MYRIWYMLQDIILALFFLLPIFIILWKYRFRALKSTFYYFVFAIYLVAIYSVVGFPSVMYIRLDFNYNIVPFIGMISSPENTLLNVFLFVPLGFFLPILCEKYHYFKATITFGLITTVCIELLQILTFRASDIDDIITNVIGTAVGYMIAKFVVKAIPKIMLHEKNSKNIYLAIAISFGVMFFFVPLVSYALYFLNA